MQNEIYNDEIYLPKDLGSASDAELSNIASALKIDLPFTFLREIGRSLIKNKTTPTKELLLFFSELRNRSKKNIENVALAGIISNDNEIVKTLNDLYAKAKHVKAFSGAPLRFGELIKISPTYLESVGAHSPKLFSVSGDSECVRILDENNATVAELSLDLSPLLPYGYVKEERENKQCQSSIALTHGTELLLITCGTDTDDYSARCEKMLADERMREICITTREIGELGLIGALASLPCGAHIEFDKLFPSCEEESTLCDLVTKFCGQLLTVTPSQHSEQMKAIAEEYGLVAVSVARVLEHPFIITVKNSRAINIEKQFIYRTLRLPAALSLKTESKPFGPTSTDSRFTLVKNDGTEKIFNGAVALDEKTLLSALSSSSVSFTDGINTALDTLFQLFAKGADRRNTEFSFKIRTSYGHSSKMLSAILGIYRVMMELCLPDAQSRLEFTSSEDEKDSLVCLAGIKNGKKLPDIPDVFSQNSIGNKVYLLSFKRIKDTDPAFMPDFAALRNTCDNLYTLISDGNVLSVKAFNKSISKAIAEMGNGKLEVISAGSIPINEDLCMQGFLVETSPKTLLNLPLLGRIVEHKETEPAELCESEENTDTSGGFTMISTTEEE